MFDYRPQRSWAKVIFSQACVKNSVHGGGVCLSACWDTPWTRHPPGTRQTPPGPGRPPLDGEPLPWEADSSIRSTSGRYASYWNAFLFNLITARNEVGARLRFLQASVILLTGRSSASVHAGMPQPPLGSRHPPEADTPQSRHSLEADPLEADTPRRQTPPSGSRHPQESRYHPSGSRHPPGKQTPPREQTPPWEQTPRQSMLGDTVNARAVRILLECNLV